MIETIIEHVRTIAPAAVPIFRSEQQMRILGVLFAHRGVEVTISDLAVMAGVAMATASREVERLEAHGLVVSRHVGRSRFVSANWDLPWADGLASILAYTVGLPYHLGVILSAVSDVQSAYLYGSWAARHAGEVGPPPADIDVLVVGDVRQESLRDTLRPLERDLGLEINPVVVTKAEWAHSNSAFLEELRSRPMFQLDLSRRADG